MTDEGSARGQGNPDTSGAPVPAVDDAADPEGIDRDGEPVEPRRASALDADPGPGAASTADDRHPGTDGRVDGRDGGVTTRLARRCLTTTAILIGVAALCLLAVTLRAWDLASAVLALVSLLVILGAVIMVRRWVFWRSVARATTLPPGHGILATTGAPRPLSPKRNGSPLKRRLGPLVLPLRADSGATPGDGALIVHARADGAVPAAGDRLRVVPIARRGDPIAEGTEPRAAIRVLLVRESDGTMFVATTRVTDTW